MKVNIYTVTENDEWWQDFWKRTGGTAVLERVIEGTDWSDCMRQHHEIMGWEPYVPEDV